MDILKELSPVLQLVLTLCSIFGVYLSVNNRQIRHDAKLSELELRFNRKDDYDKELKNDVKKLVDEVGKITVSLEFLKPSK